MATDPLDDSIDQLYQLSLDEFTAARNALAKGAGARASEIKQLEKPSLAAWAVNQLFWKERLTYDGLIKTAAKRQDAYRQVLGGKSVDVQTVEADHAASIRRATEAARKILEQGGNKPTEAVLTALAETLDALPGADAPGRLAKPLRRIGFGGLAGVTVAPAAKREPIVLAPRPVAKPSEKPDVAAQKAAIAKQKEAAEKTAREHAMTRERLRFAEAAEREAEEALGRAQRTTERVKRTHERIEEELAEAAEALDKAGKEESAAASALKKATTERERLARSLS